MSELRIQNTKWEDVFSQAFGSQITNFHKAIEVIDTRFGEGYAKKHPELISAFLQASAVEWSNINIAVMLQNLNDSLKRTNQAIEDIQVRL